MCKYVGSILKTPAPGQKTLNTLWNEYAHPLFKAGKPYLQMEAWRAEFKPTPPQMIWGLPGLGDIGIASVNGFVGCCGARTYYKPKMWEDASSAGVDIYIGPEEVLTPPEHAEYHVVPGFPGEYIHIRFVGKDQQWDRRWDYLKAPDDTAPVHADPNYVGVYFASVYSMTSSVMEGITLKDLRKHKDKFLFMILTRSQQELVREVEAEFEQEIVFKSRYVMNTNYPTDPERLKLIIIKL